MSYPKTFDASGPIAASITNRSGDIVVTAQQGGAEVVVDLRPSRANSEAALDVIAASTVEFRNGSLEVTIPDLKLRAFNANAGVDVVITLPAGSTVRAKNGSGDVQLRGELADVNVAAGSGDVEIEQAKGVTVKTGSGDIVVRAAQTANLVSGSGDIRADGVRGDVSAESASGDLHVDAVRADGRLNTASGDVHVEELAGRLRTKTASGDLSIARATSGSIESRTASGDLTVAVVNGTAVRLDISTLSGRVHSELDESEAPADSDDTLELIAKSMSGSVSVVRTS